MQKQPTKILVIIPAFNEEETIGAVISSVRDAVPSANIVVVNDGSGDNTEHVARTHGIKVLNHPFNLGIGASMQTGYKYALANNYEIAVQVDADRQHPVDRIKNLLDPILKNEADVVVGSRFMGQGDYRPSLARGAGIAFFSRLVSILIKEKMTDTTSGFRAVGPSVIDFFSRNYPDDYPEVESLVLLHKKGFRIKEIPVNMSERAGGRSSITPLKSFYYMIKVFLAILVELLRKV
ncbi:MAG: glycosyltransferase family 2 protein [Deltaproteobacteria bacterium]|nr:glycosyltransferase family 2 protein [Deltaproteobacteria bacterium]